MKFLFWNVKKNPVGPILSKIVEGHRVDIVILAECSEPGDILIELNDASEDQFHLADNPGPRVVIYTASCGGISQPLSARNSLLCG